MIEHSMEVTKIVRFSENDPIRCGRCDFMSLDTYDAYCGLPGKGSSTIHKSRTEKCLKHFYGKDNLVAGSYKLEFNRYCKILTPEEYTIVKDCFESIQSKANSKIVLLETDNSNKIQYKFYKLIKTPENILKWYDVKSLELDVKFFSEEKS